MSPKLTTRLLESPNTQGLYHAATTARPFLVAAANGTLSHRLLGFYIAQDEVYAEYAYPKCIKGLFRRIDAYRNASQPSQPRTLLPVLAASMTGVVREVKFFDSLATQYGVNLRDSTSESPPHTKRSATLNYVAAMAYVAGGRKPGNCIPLGHGEGVPFTNTSLVSCRLIGDWPGVRANHTSVSMIS